MAAAKSSKRGTRNRPADELTAGEARGLAYLREELATWLDRFGRELPWRREDASDYERIVVEVLLQRTTARAVANMYEEFVERFPNWHSLASASERELAEVLRPLGLWQRRAKSLGGLARYAANAGGRFPADVADHSDIPAVGQYVSNAILLFQHGKPAPLIDVNMARVIERFLRPRRLADIRHDPWLQSAAWEYARGPAPCEANWAMLDFAAAICKARSPLCDACPVNRRCSYFARNAGGADGE